MNKTSCYIVTDAVQEIESVPETGYAPFFFPTEGAYLPFYFTDETFTKVLSALMNGAFLTYGDEGMQTIWYFLQNVEYPVNLCAQIADALLTCEDVQAALASLIAGNETIQNSIVDMLQDNDEFNNYLKTTIEGLTTGQITGKILQGSCDKSIVAGKVVAIVERMNAINEDALEILEVGSNDEEKVSTLVEGIPGVGILPFDEIIDFLQDLLEDFGENYAAAVTDEWKDDVEEDLYCLAREKPDCSLTYQDLFDYFQARAVSGLTIGSTISDIVAFVVTGDFATDELIASGLYAVQLALILTGKEFFGMDLPRIGSITRDALPSSKWEEWNECTDTAYAYRWTFSEGDGGWILNGTGQGLYDDGAWQFAQFVGGPTYYVAAQLRKTVPIDANILEIDVHLADVVLGIDNGGRFVIANAATLTSPPTQPTQADNHIYTFGVDQDDDEIVVVARASSNVGGYGGGSGRVTAVTVRGDSPTLPAFTGGAFI